MGSGLVLGNTIQDNEYLGIAGFGNVGFGNNVLTGNNRNHGGEQVFHGVPLHPNVCEPAC
jgi:hypothetical protein